MRTITKNQKKNVVDEEEAEGGGAVAKFVALFDHVGIM